MKKILIVTFVGLFLFVHGAKKENNVIYVSEITPINELLSNPLKLNEKQVAIHGIISHVCQNSGAKMRVAEIDGEGLSVLVRLNEHTNSFSPELEGREIIITGMLVAWIRNFDQLEEESGHKGAQEKGHTCQSTQKAMKLIKEKGLDSEIGSHVDLIKFEWK